jgi:hypothetical protein
MITPLGDNILRKGEGGPADNQSKLLLAVTLFWIAFYESSYLVPLTPPPPS